MRPVAKPLMMLAAVGYGVLFSLSFTGAVRLGCWLVGMSLSERVMGNLFLSSSLLTGALSAYLYSRSLRPSTSPARLAVPATRSRP